MKKATTTESTTAKKAANATKKMSEEENTMKKAAATETTTAKKTINTLTYQPGAVVLNGRSYEATYSDGSAKGQGVYVFVQLEGAPIRIHIGEDMPDYPAALAIAKGSKAAPAVVERPAVKAAEADKPATLAKQGKPAEVVAPVAEKTAAPAKKPERKRASKPAARPAEAPAVKVPEGYSAKVSEAGAVVMVERHEEITAAPVVEKAAPVSEAAAPIVKPWIGSTIEGKGWRIVFDAETQRTRIVFDAAPTDAQKAAVEAAGFYFSAQLKSWNKKLTFKAHRAALELAASLRAIA